VQNQALQLLKEYDIVTDMGEELGVGNI